MIFLELFARFFFVGLFAIGGGPATIPFLMDMAEGEKGIVEQSLSKQLRKFFNQYLNKLQQK